MSRWLAAAVVLGCWGCAFTLDGPDPNRPRNYVPKCDTSKGLVALDGVMATALGVTALSLTSESEPAIALVPLGLGALYLAGAVSGNRTANACQAAIDDYSRTYGDERMVLGDGSEGAPPLEDDDSEDRRRRAKRTSGRGQAGQPGYPQQPYPQPEYPQQGQQQTPYQPPRSPAAASPQQVPQQPVPQQPAQVPQQPPPQQPPGQRPAKTKAPQPTPEGDEDWSDFWREVP